MLQLFFCKFRKIFKNTFFTELLDGCLCGLSTTYCNQWLLSIMKSKLKFEKLPSIFSKHCQLTSLTFTQCCWRSVDKAWFAIITKFWIEKIFDFSMNASFSYRSSHWRCSARKGVLRNKLQASAFLRTPLLQNMSERLLLQLLSKSK